MPNNTQEPEIPLRSLPIEPIGAFSSNSNASCGECPAVAPLGVLDNASKQRLQIAMDDIQANAKKLANTDLAAKVIDAVGLLDAQQQTSLVENEQDVDARLYDGFIGDSDKSACRVVRSASPEEFSTLNLAFKDDRLNALLPLYKARNYPKSLSDEERAAWEQFRQHKLLDGKQSSRLARYFARLGELANGANVTAKQQYLLEELQLYGQSIMPVDTDY